MNHNVNRNAELLSLVKDQFRDRLQPLARKPRAFTAQIEHLKDGLRGILKDAKADLSPRDKAWVYTALVALDEVALEIAVPSVRKAS